MWDAVAKRIRDNNRFVLTTHINPDGDAIGSEIALAAFLEELGKEVVIVNSSPTPLNSIFMAPPERILVYPDGYTPSILDNTDQIIILDVSTWGHLGPFGDAIKESSKPRMCIDHHQGTGDGFADVLAIDTSAAAAGVLVYELIKYMGGDITPRIADAVYATVITDTGTFRFSNTDTRVFKIAAELSGRGVDPFTIHRHMFSKTRGAVRLLGAVLRTMEMTDDGKIAWLHVTEDMFRESDATYDDSDGLIDVVRAIESVELCMFFKEIDGGNVKVSLRSNGSVDVFELAKRYGGGGHRMAAGMTINGSMDQAIEKVVDNCKTGELPRV